MKKTIKPKKKGVTERVLLTVDKKNYRSVKKYLDANGYNASKVWDELLGILAEGISKGEEIFKLHLHLTKSKEVKKR